MFKIQFSPVTKMETCGCSTFIIITTFSRSK